MTKRKKGRIDPEWSHPVDIEKIESKPLTLSIEPDDEEKEALCQRLGVRAIEALRADLKFARDAGAVIHVTGRIEAELVQDCVISTEPVKSRIAEDFEAWYADPEKTVIFAKARRERNMNKANVEVPILDESEDPEPAVDGKIDAGELTTQYLSLFINPYPHAEGAAYKGPPEKGGRKAQDASFKNPFAALKAWKGQQE